MHGIMESTRPRLIEIVVRYAKWQADPLGKSTGKPPPQVMLMDEPFGALDSQTRTVMQEILTNMWQQLQLSVLFITHDIEEAIFLSEKVYVMTA